MYDDSTTFYKKERSLPAIPLESIDAKHLVNDFAMFHFVTGYKHSQPNGLAPPGPGSIASPDNVKPSRFLNPSYPAKVTKVPIEWANMKAGNFEYLERVVL